MQQATRRWPHRLLGAALLAAAFLAGASVREAQDVRAQTRSQRTQKPQARTHFLSGGARSETVLVEIAGTLKRMEGRLERLEEIARRATLGPSAAGTGNTERTR